MSGGPGIGDGRLPPRPLVRRDGTSRHKPDQPDSTSLTVMEAGTALEPVVLRAMERAGWEIHPTDRENPQRVSVPIGPTMRVSGHPDATGIMPIFGGEAVIEVKTRNPDAFKRWQVLGAERSHPNAVVQAAVYTLGTFGEMRDAVIACMDTGSARGTTRSSPASGWRKPCRMPASGLGSLPPTTSLSGPTQMLCPNATSPRSRGNAAAARSWRPASRKRPSRRTPQLKATRT